MEGYDVSFDVEVTPPASERAFNPRDLGVRLRHGKAGYSYGSDTGGSIIENLGNWVLSVYHKTAHQKINQYLGPDETKYAIEVDGVPGAAIETASLEGSGIVAAPFGDVKVLKAAVEAALRYLHSVVPGSFKRSRGYYQRSANTTSFFTVRVNGTEVSSINWDNVTVRSNIQIYSKARYAAPLESIHHGKLLLGARNAAKTSGGGAIRSSFTYRNPTKMGQVPQHGRKRTFDPLSVPVLEVGLFGSGVTDYVGNIHTSLERGRKREKPNLIQRNILPESRWITKRPRKSPLR